MIVADRERWQRLSPLLDGLLDLDGLARAARLEAIERDDAGLAAELRGWLADAERAERARFLAGNGAGSGETQLHRLAGERIGAYVLEAPLGQGGSGVVWRAKRADGRYEGAVAVKLLHLSLLGRSAALRFEREGAILARLEHPNIARLLDAGVTVAGQPYLVLELVEGERIDRHCDAGKLPVAARVDLFRAVLSAVAHAHRHLVVHRDIKPANILVTRDGVAKLLDFGIARLLRDDLAPEAASEITRDGGRALTPDYAAPEQLRGDDVTTATDTYSLGVLLYELLAGRHPGADATGGSSTRTPTAPGAEPKRLSSAVTTASGVTAERLQRIAGDRATSPQRLNASLRGDLDLVVDKAMRPEPGDRYASVDAFAEDLRRARAGEPLLARPSSLAYRTSRFVSRHRGAVAATALTLAAIVAGVVGTVTQARRAEQQAHQAQIERDNALRDLAFAGAARDLLSLLVSQGNSKAQTATELLGRAEALADGQFADDPLSRGRLQLMLGIEYGNLQEYERSKRVLMQAQASAKAASSAELAINVDCVLAATLGDQNEPQRAMALFAEAIGRVQRRPEEADSVLSACLHMRADLNAHLGHPQAMLADAQAALVALGTPRADQRVLANSLRVTVAEAYGRLGRTAEAVAAYESSIADLASMGRQSSARTVVRFANFSRLLYVAGQARRAEEMAARGLALSRGSGEGNEVDAILEGNRARALIELGRFEEANALTEHALASALERKDLRWAGTFALYGAPGRCAVGDDDRCAALLAIARDKLQATLPSAHSTLATLAVAEAALSQARGQRALAADQLAAAVAIFDAAKDANPLRIRALALLARAEQTAGDLPAAARHVELAVVQARQGAKGFASSEWLGTALLAQGQVLRAAGDKASAQAALREAATQLQAALGDDAPQTREARALLASF